MENPVFDNEHLIKLANQKIYFGKHSGKYLIDLPEPYLLWLRKQELDNQSFRNLVSEVCTIKENGLEGLIRKLRN